MRYFYLCLYIPMTVIAYGQQYEDFLGAGQDMGVTITTSHNHGTATGNKTMNGDGMNAKLFEASRFLAQASLGANMATIEYVSDIGFGAWIDEQCALPVTSLSATMDQEFAEALALYVQNGGNANDYYGPWALHFNYAWWDMTITRPDILRQRVALALSEILVISINSDLEGRGEALVNFYDLFLNHAFGNYKNLLKDVALHTAMGYYLSHLDNPKSIPAENIHPDENFAREIMQLFTIGLYMLNNNGTNQIDQNGNFIPTYDNNDIKELAKVFTGLGAGAVAPWVDWTNEPYFGLGAWGADMTVPMVMYEQWHEPGQKTLLGSYTIPSGQSGMQDINQAIDFLFNHQNVGPFISYRLIQRLVKSNPTPAYVGRVAAKFNNNGFGERGDLKAVIKAILLDPEARECSWQMHPENGKLKEPIVRYTHATRAFPLDSPNDNYWNNGFSFLEASDQHPLASPTVFNFFLPDYQPNGALADNDLMGPEFQIHNSQTSIAYINQVNQWIVWHSLWWSWEDGDPAVEIDRSQLEPLAEYPEELINHLDIILTHGMLSDHTRNVIRQAMEGLVWGDYLHDRTEMAIYLMLISPDYAILK
jgi:uncharacterized protein (DUF1800 family)